MHNRPDSDSVCVSQRRPTVALHGGDAVDSCRPEAARRVLVLTRWYFNPCLSGHKEESLWPLRDVLLRLWWRWCVIT